MKLPLDEAQCRALEALRRGLPEVRMVLIGAAALGYHVPLPRTTADLDLAIAVEPHELEGRLEPLGWRRDPKMQQRWRGPGSVVLDLLPATEKLLAEGALRFDGGSVSMSLVGFDLALRHTVSASLGGDGVRVELATLPVLVLLKIVAWLDRPSEREKDLGDLAFVLEHALPDDDERRWDPEGPLFLSGLDHEDQGAFLVGLEVGRVAEDSHLVRVERFLDLLHAPEGSAFSALLRSARLGGGAPEERLERRLAAFEQGLQASR